MGKKETSPILTNRGKSLTNQLKRNAMDMETLNRTPIKLNRIETKKLGVKFVQEVWSGEFLLGTVQRINYKLGWSNSLIGYNDSEVFTTRKQAVNDLKERIIFTTN